MNDNSSELTWYRLFHARRRRKQGALLFALLAVAILALTVAQIIVPDRQASEAENRKLAQLPTLSWDALTDGSYFSDWESYLADQFFRRDDWIALDLQFRRAIGNREVNGVYLCDDGYLMESLAEPQNEDKIAAINAFAARHSTLNIDMAVIPNAACVLSEKLPDYAPVRDQRADLRALADRLGGVEFTDVTNALAEHADEKIYYKTDHHWTSLGARYAFEAMASALEIDAPISDYSVYTVATDFEGTLASKSGSHAVRDSVEIYLPQTDIEYYVTYAESGERSGSMYVRDCLNEKDKYTVFFGGNHARVDIQTTADTGRCLLLIKDSYANAFVQFLYPYFDRIIMIDPRYCYDSADTIIRREGVTDVLFLYNANTFFADTTLPELLASTEN